MKPLSVKQCSDLLQSKQISATELAQDYLNQIQEHNPAINAYIHLDADRTLAQAQKADERLQSGTDSLLTGVPIAVKANFCEEGWTTSCGSKMLENFIAPYTAHVVQNVRNHGMVSLGKVNMDEFAMGSTSESSFFGITRNPWNLNHVPGGSSGGSAAAVAARLAPAALGSDTGGSIRQPAAHCGVTGIKPTYGIISRFGMVAYASSLDQAGPMAQTAEDCALLLNAMAGFDERDSTSLERAKEDYMRDLNLPLTGLRVGLPKEYLEGGLNADVAATVQNTVDLLKSLGAQMVDISLRQTEFVIPAYYVIATAEASTNLSRFDGVRYGHRTDSFESLDEFYSKNRAEGFGEEVKRRIMMGTYVLSHGYYDAYYVKAQQLRRLVSNDFQAAFEQCDVILAPASPTAAPAIGSQTKDPVQMYLSDVFTTSLNLAGLPGISVPAGFSQDGLPIGMQLFGNYFAEAKLLNVAHQIQLNSDYHTRTPA
ncbi:MULTISPECIES: Asp-tRNA(Asn)/Glu-tRNA(Gln) amidotransferase subunit GatA [Vitreoscilla]|uniref:Glutamyl-tRNA(Gln) amidotransferase subunit A n=1 Tax=Vitreoscilla stercoraria TaxID=61 RepID=A0ABY4E8E4_VITST|nr:MULTISPECIES: Asp-tRNA(Asn)/Glu-tRNA(Gln) amidotransferase subunit GatA [Vitreoscilla]AUZ04591.1 subunit A of aspartyl/glutamyl-tRNA amidotransferase [Vitreoscilla sp. C1]UOO91709.1 Asp-tRNA(Asn)/Glu-tRNA(Gln) amidotransferase subunit GatA [Vitreoscilla stercoraria]